MKNKSIDDVQEPIDMSSKRILIVDDEPAIAQVISRQLRAKGCVTQSAGSAEDAILLVKENRFDLILLDLNLPGANGFSMIKTLENLSNAVILVMTGHADDEIRKDAMLLGAAELIAKPFEHQQLVSAIRNSVARTKSTCCADRYKSPSEEVPGTSA